VNILTNHAVHKKRITVFGGNQMRPNIHIEDITDLYVHGLEWPDEAIDGKIFNAGYENRKVVEIAEIVRGVVGKEVAVVTTPTNDNRSYHISSRKIKNELGFEPRHTIEEAVRDLVEAFGSGRLPDAMTGIRYYNIKTMQALNLK
jgi:nucleoside-diphosphate-sugar epimerase